jgi:hypothetical protein
MKMKSKMGMAGGRKTKMGMAGGKKTKMGYAGGKKTKLPMVEKNGEMVPFFAADGKGKMMAGRMVPKTKGYFKGGKVMQSKMATKGGKRGGTG